MQCFCLPQLQISDKMRQLSLGSEQPSIISRGHVGLYYRLPLTFILFSWLALRGHPQITCREMYSVFSLISLNVSSALIRACFFPVVGETKSKRPPVILIIVPARRGRVEQAPKLLLDKLTKILRHANMSFVAERDSHAKRGLQALFPGSASLIKASTAIASVGWWEKRASASSFPIMLTDDCIHRHNQRSSPTDITSPQTWALHPTYACRAVSNPAQWVQLCEHFVVDINLQ